MRELEKYYCDYIILGIPKRPFRYFISFFIKKGIRPTVYAQNANWPLKISRLAKFCISDSFLHDVIVLEVLERHASQKGNRKLSLIVKDARFGGFVRRNRQKLEKIFIIQEDHNTGDRK